MRIKKNRKINTVDAHEYLPVCAADHRPLYVQERVRCSRERESSASAIRLTYGMIVDVVGRREDLLACYDGEEGPESAVCGHQ